MNDVAVSKLEPDTRYLAPTPHGADGLRHYRMYIDGAFVDPKQDEWIETTECQA